MTNTTESFTAELRLRNKEEVPTVLFLGYNSDGSRQHYIDGDLERLQASLANIFLDFPDLFATVVGRVMLGQDRIGEEK